MGMDSSSAMLYRWKAPLRCLPSYAEQKNLTLNKENRASLIPFDFFSTVALTKQRKIMQSKLLLAACFTLWLSADRILHEGSPG